jgi:biotin synthase
LIVSSTWCEKSKRSVCRLASRSACSAQVRPEKLKEAGLDYYNHNLDTDKEFYGQVIKTHTHDDRLDTLDQVREAGINVCSGGIIGMGESRKNRAGLIVQLANLPKPPESVPINNLVPIPGDADGSE